MQIHHSTQHSKKASFAKLPLFISLLAITMPFSSVWAETSYEVQSGDSLSKIIANNYPNVARQSYNIIMQHTLKSNPDAFSNENMNSLRLGKTLILTAEEDIEGLQPKPPEPIPVNPEEFNKLQSQNNDLEKQLQALTSELEKIKNSSTAESNSSNPTQEDSLQSTQLTESKELISQLQAQIATLKSGNVAQNPVDTDTAGKQQLNEDLQTANKQIESLKADVEQLNALITKLEADQEDNTQANTGADPAKQEELQAEVDLLQGLITKNEADQEENETIIKQLKEKVATLSADKPAPTEGESAASNNNEQLSQLQQENNLLKAEIEKAREKANQDNNTINQLKADLAAATSVIPEQTLPVTDPATTTKPESQKEPSTWLKLSILSWLLPLLAILIGLYLLSRLIKRNRDKQATDDFKTAMATSASSNTASAFGIDGSAPTPHSAPNKSDTPVEKDSLEAGVKIDIARAYIDLNEIDAANEILQEAMIEGSTSQKKAAEKLLQ